MSANPPNDTNENESATQPIWEVIPERTQEHWLEVRDPDGWWEAVVKWDGCIHLHHAGNVPFDKEHGDSQSSEAERDKSACDDYIHLCDIDDAIARLQALKQMALAHFGNWPG